MCRQESDLILGAVPVQDDSFFYAPSPIHGIDTQPYRKPRISKSNGLLVSLVRNIPEKKADIERTGTVKGDPDIEALYSSATSLSEWKHREIR